MVPLRNFLNTTESFIPDALRGLVAATADLRWDREHGYLIRDSPLRPGQVAIVSGGGSGHEPLHAGFIGRGMLTAACPGLIFTSPNALQIAGATVAADAGGGVLHVVKNYTGDVMNFSIARQIAGESSVRTEVVLVDDDVATEVADAAKPGRRGTAATVVVEKLCGAAAERGDQLAAVAALGRRVAASARSMAVALSPCTVPGAPVPSFDLPTGEMEIGVGIHGERGVDRAPVAPAAEIVAALLARILPAAQVRSGDEVIVVVNGLGATHSLELNLLFGEVAAQLAAAGIAVGRSLVGSFVTALDMAGASITVVRADPEMFELWDAPTSAPGWPAVTGPPVGRLIDGTIVEPTDRADRGGENRWLSAFVERVRASVGMLTDLTGAPETVISGRIWPPRCGTTSCRCAEPMPMCCLPCRPRISCARAAPPVRYSAPSSVRCTGARQRALVYRAGGPCRAARSGSDPGAGRRSGRRQDRGRRRVAGRGRPRCRCATGHPTGPGPAVRRRCGRGGCPGHQGCDSRARPGQLRG